MAARRWAREFGLAEEADLQRRVEALHARFHRLGIPKEAAGVDSPAPPISAAAGDRLATFAANQIVSVQKRVGEPLAAPWPPIEGCLGVLFTSRTGSSYLARQLAARFDIGRMEECLNPHLVDGIAAAKIVRSFAGRWFSFKLGVPGIISAELTGAIDQYLDQSCFILLLRRNIVAQAVSLVKANQTGVWHSIHPPSATEPVYDGGKIGQSVRIISSGVASLADYLAKTGRPWRKLAYEDFADGDLSAAVAVCEGFGVPAVDPDKAPRLPPLEKTTDAVNEAWIDRFMQNVEPKVQDAIDRYRTYL